MALATRLVVVAFHLDDEPSTWYQWMDKGGKLTTWDAFIHGLRKRFGASILDYPLGRISKRVQTGTVSQYRAKFEGLMMRITGVSDPIYIS